MTIHVNVYAAHDDVWPRGERTVEIADGGGQVLIPMSEIPDLIARLRTAQSAELGHIHG